MLNKDDVDVVVVAVVSRAEQDGTWDAHLHACQDEHGKMFANGLSEDAMFPPSRGALRLVLPRYWCMEAWRHA